jgi:CBS domain containing-hemolysin-like protein
VLFEWGINSSTVVHSISFIIAFGLITFLHVVFGELAPKSLAIQKAESISLWLARPMRFFYYIFYPAVALLNGTANKIIVLLGFQAANKTEETHTEEELRMLISESFQGGQIKESEQELLQNVFRFEERVAEEIMVPRPEVVFLNINNSLEENMNLARRSGHTRYPVIDKSPDNVIGAINIKDIVYNMELKSIKDIIRDIMFIPEGMPIDHLLHTFQAKHQHLAVVINEYGGTSGIVTLENVLEELVGEIQDEFDNEEPEILIEDTGTLIVGGRMFIDEAIERFGLLIPDQHQYNTLAGYMLGRLGKRPQVGDIIIQGNTKMEVAKMQGMRIDRIRIYPISHKKPDL